MAAARLQRWAITLSAYQYDLEFRPTEEHGNADGLSRLPLEDSCTECDTVSEASLFNINQIGVLPITPERLKQETAKDPVLSRVLRHMMDGWPTKAKKDLHPFFNRRQELTVELGCLLWGVKVIIPPKLREWVLAELHTAHPGIVKMKSLARQHVWWPGIDKDVEAIVRKCVPCQSYRNKAPPTTLHP